MSRKYTKEEIIKCVEGSKTPSECLLKLGVAPISPEIRNDSKRKFHSCVLQGLLQQPLFSNRLLIYGAL